MQPIFYYPDTPELPLPEGHRFPASKYRLVRERVVAEGVLRADQLSPSPAATDEELTTTHAPNYVAAVADGTLAPDIQRRIGLPWSPVLARRSRATVGGTLAAARCALTTGISGQLAGGTHHAHFDFGSGYCTFNDFAVTANVLLAEGRVARVAVLDLDVHQGDGNAALLTPVADVFVVSVHGERNFPFRKVASDLDLALADGTTDREYLHAVADALSAVGAFNPDLLLYNAGVDPLEEDRLGRLAVSADGLAERDTMVMTFATRRGIPLVIAMGGGYAQPIDASVSAYATTWRIAKDLFRF